MSMILPLLLMSLATGDVSLPSPSCGPAPTSAASTALPGEDVDNVATAAPQVVTVSSCAPGSDGPAQRRQRVLRQLDAVRLAAGAGGLASSRELDMSASRHAAYLSLNGFRSAPTVHAETPGLPAFTGADPFARMREAGYRMSYATEVIGDVGSTAVDTDCLPRLLNTIYHAALLLSRVTEGGVAYGDGAAAGTCTIDLAAPANSQAGQTAVSGELVRYPWPGMVAETGSFLVGSENPRPPPSPLPNANVGIPVLVGLRNAAIVAGAPGARVELQRFELSDERGRPIPGVVFADTAISGPGVVADAGLHGLFAALVPQLPLSPGRYRVTLRAKIGSRQIEPTPWWFSVGAP